MDPISFVLYALQCSGSNNACQALGRPPSINLHWSGGSPTTEGTGDSPPGHSFLERSIEHSQLH